MSLLLLFTLQILGLSSSFQIPTPSNTIGKLIYSTAPAENDIRHDVEAAETVLVWDDDDAMQQVKDLERLTGSSDTDIEPALHFHQNAKKMYDDVIDACNDGCDHD